MAKKIAGTDRYLPGVIYELEVQVDSVWTPFYVGETTNPDRRFQQHRSAAAAATEHSTCVYRTIALIFEPEGLAWRLQPVAEYGDTGPEAEENEQIMLRLRQQHVLTNEKKGNANWLAERQAEARHMTQLGMTNYAEYRQRVSQQQLNQRHQQWIEQDPAEQSPLRQQAVAILNSVRVTIGTMAQQTAQRTADRQQRAEQRAERVAAARAQQQAAWLINNKFFGESNE
jgi:hypothetical protein